MGGEDGSGGGNGDGSGSWLEGVGERRSSGSGCWLWGYRWLLGLRGEEDGSVWAGGWQRSWPSRRRERGRVLVLFSAVFRKQRKREAASCFFFFCII